MAITLTIETGTDALLTLEGIESAVLHAEATTYVHTDDIYTGAYVVTPKAWEEQTLETAHKLMEDDVTVLRVPYYETVNLFDGKTAYIAEEV